MRARYCGGSTPCFLKNIRFFVDCEIPIYTLEFQSHPAHYHSISAVFVIHTCINICGIVSNKASPLLVASGVEGRGGRGPVPTENVGKLRGYCDIYPTSGPSHSEDTVHTREAIFLEGQ